VSTVVVIGIDIKTVTDAMEAIAVPQTVIPITFKTVGLLLMTVLISVPDGITTNVLEVPVEPTHQPQHMLHLPKSVQEEVLSLVNVIQMPIMHPINAAARQYSDNGLIMNATELARVAAAIHG